MDIPTMMPLVMLFALFLAQVTSQNEPLRLTASRIAPLPNNVVVLRCRVRVGGTPPDLTFETTNGTALQGDSDQTGLDEGELRVTITEHSTVWCKDTTRRSNILQIPVFPSGPPPDEELYVFRGDTEELNCTTLNPPPEDFRDLYTFDQWDRVLQGGGQQFITLQSEPDRIDPETFALTVNMEDVQDGDSYQCQISIAFSNDSDGTHRARGAKVTIRIAERINVTGNLTDIEEITVGEQVTFSCSIAGTNVSSVHWDVGDDIFTDCSNPAFCVATSQVNTTFQESTFAIDTTNIDIGSVRIECGAQQELNGEVMRDDMSTSLTVRPVPTVISASTPSSTMLPPTTTTPVPSSTPTLPVMPPESAAPPGGNSDLKDIVIIATIGVLILVILVVVTVLLICYGGHRYRKKHPKPTSDPEWPVVNRFLSFFSNENNRNHIYETISPRSGPIARDIPPELPLHLFQATPPDPGPPELERQFGREDDLSSVFTESHYSSTGTGSSYAYPPSVISIGPESGYDTTHSDNSAPNSPKMPRKPLVRMNKLDIPGTESQTPVHIRNPTWYLLHFTSTGYLSHRQCTKTIGLTPVVESVEPPDSSKNKTYADYGQLATDEEMPDSSSYAQQKLTLARRVRTPVEDSSQQSNLQIIDKLDPSVPFMDGMDVIQCDSLGGHYYNPTCDFVLEIPGGAVPEGTTIQIEVGVSLYGPFQFPENARPISPIVWLCVRQPQPEDFEFLKPVKVTLPHYLDLTDGGEESLELGFLKADHSLNQNGKYQFIDIGDGKATFQPEYGVIHTNHFCYLCLKARSGLQLTSRSLFYLHRIVPKPITTTAWDIVFCVTFSMRLCIESVKQQYPPQRGYKTTSNRFKFKMRGDGTEPKIKIRFRSHPPGGWQLVLESERSEIAFSEVKFWDKEMDEMALMHETKEYPPKLTIEVSGEVAITKSAVEVTFTGVDDQYLGSINTHISLLHPQLKGPMNHGHDDCTSSALVIPRAFSCPGMVMANARRQLFPLTLSGTAAAQPLALEYNTEHASINSESSISSGFASISSTTPPFSSSSVSGFHFLPTRDISTSCYSHPALQKEPELRELMNEVAAKVPDKWWSIGIQLGLSAGSLNCIASIPDAMEHFSKVFIDWEKQRTAPYNWLTIIRTLEVPSVGEYALAQHITDTLVGETAL